MPRWLMRNTWDNRIGNIRLANCNSCFTSKANTPSGMISAATVLTPALEEINDFGTVTVKATPKNVGRSVRFDWHWKDPHAATETAVENERHSHARRKAQETADAPPHD